ncbi:unnamed protein product, partial [marine sediment metagenome]
MASTATISNAQTANSCALANAPTLALAHAPPGAHHRTSAKKSIAQAAKYANLCKKDPA